MNTGDMARVVAPIIEGEIAKVRFDPETGEKELLLAWVSDGESHTRWFKEAELEPAE